MSAKVGAAAAILMMLASFRSGWVGRSVGAIAIAAQNIGDDAPTSRTDVRGRERTQSHTALAHWKRGTRYAHVPRPLGEPAASEEKRTRERQPSMLAAAATGP